MKKKKNIERLNLYLDKDLSDAIKANAQADYLRPTTWVSQFLRKSLLGKDNKSTKTLNHEEQ